MWAPLYVFVVVASTLLTAEVIKVFSTLFALIGYRKARIFSILLKTECRAKGIRHSAMTAETPSALVGKCILRVFVVGLLTTFCVSSRFSFFIRVHSKKVSPPSFS